MGLSNTETSERLLRVIIALLVRQGVEESRPLKQQIEILADLGLRPADIAKTLGRTSTYINKELAGIRKKKKG